LAGCDPEDVDLVTAKAVALFSFGPLALDDAALVVDLFPFGAVERVALADLDADVGGELDRAGRAAREGLAVTAGGAAG